MVEHKDNRLTLQIEPSLELRARKVADSMGESVSSLVRAAIRDYLDRFDDGSLSAYARYEAIQETTNRPAKVDDEARFLAFALSAYKAMDKFK